MSSRHSRVAVVIPCYNEERTVAKVVADFRQALPDARIYVYDNNSSDATVAQARAAGAIVGREPLQGKGNVVRRMFADVEADIYVLSDGDDTYEAARAPEMIRCLVDRHLDMVNGLRQTSSDTAYRPGHRLGNVVLSGIVRLVFGDRIKDMLSGYRVLSRRFVKSFPALSMGFETETELTVHALELGMPTAEIATLYKERPEGSTSKLNTIRDGVRILRTIGKVIKEERPFMFFGAAAVVLAGVSLAFGWSILVEFRETGLVPRLPTAVLATGIMLVAVLSLGAGLILESVALGRRELRRLHYLALPGPAGLAASDPYPAGEPEQPERSLVHELGH